MAKEFWTVTEVVEIFQIDEGFITDLEEEEVIIPVYRKKPPTKLFPYEELEKMRIAKILMEDMDVNLAGVEIILRMRENMIGMRRQFDNILEELAQQIRETFGKVR